MKYVQINKYRYIYSPQCGASDSLVAKINIVKIQSDCMQLKEQTILRELMHNQSLHVVSPVKSLTVTD